MMSVWLIVYMAGTVVTFLFMSVLLLGWKSLSDAVTCIVIGILWPVAMGVGLAIVVSDVMDPITMDEGFEDAEKRSDKDTFSDADG